MEEELNPGITRLKPQTAPQKTIWLDGGLEARKLRSIGSELNELECRKTPGLR